MYGTLAPGESNAHILADLRGRWERAEDSGYVFPEGCAASEFYPAIIIATGDDPAAPRVQGRLFISEDLPEFWPALDTFEGPCYERVVVKVRGCDSGEVEAYVYELRDQTGMLDNQ